MFSIAGIIPVKLLDKNLISCVKSKNCNFQFFDTPKNDLYVHKEIQTNEQQTNPVFLRNASIHRNVCLKWQKVEKEYVTLYRACTVTSPLSTSYHLRHKTCWWWFSTETGHRFFPQSVVLVRCRRLQDLLVLQGTTKSTRKKTQELLRLLIGSKLWKGNIAYNIPIPIRKWRILVLPLTMRLYK